MKPNTSSSTSTIPLLIIPKISRSRSPISRLHKFVFCFTFCIFLIVILILIVVINLMDMGYIQKPRALIQRNVTIYMATTVFEDPISKWNPLIACPHIQKNCRISMNKADLLNASAVVFHNKDFTNQHLKAPFTSHPRNWKIPYVWWTMESPTNPSGSFLKVPSNFVNWTMHYMTNADIWYPYARFKKRSKMAVIDLDSIWAKKSDEKLAVWIASNCHTHNLREKLVNELKNASMKIDVFGKCGELLPADCTSKCAHDLASKYKFYMALENSYCMDYATEKFCDSLSVRDLIPIVAKRGIYQNLQLPPQSIIAVDDFETIDEFVAFIDELSKSKDRYLEYFKWRADYEIKGRDVDLGFCALCQKVIDGNFEPKTYEDPNGWLLERSCDNDFKIKRLDTR